jgi:hypothetical protein
VALRVLEPAGFLPEATLLIYRTLDQNKELAPNWFSKGMLVAAGGAAWLLPAGQRGPDWPIFTRPRKLLSSHDFYLQSSGPGTH